ncbi:MAG: orotate phosphoribosyltransferase [Bacteroidota bacterium]|nr:orotate phosphoribosyltransferase [Bacteroidota bacterium]
MDSKKEIAEKLLQINAIKLSVDNPFTWASGWKSPIYCDNRKILSYPYVRDFIKSEMCNVVFQSFPQAEMLAGVASAGVPWGAMVADQLKLPFIYVRPKPKEHGLGNQIEGFYEQDKKVVLIEDLISTGKSSLLVADVLLKAGLEVEGLVSIFTYGFKEAVNSFANANIKCISLTDYDSLISLAIDKNIVSQNDQNTLLNWRTDPANWNVKS